MIRPPPILRVLLMLGLVSSGSATTYLTQEQALALAFEKPADAKRHEILFDDDHRKAIEAKLGEKVERKGVLAYTGSLKEGGHGVVLLDAVIGKHEFIDYMVVLDREGKVKFIEILAYRESYGGEVRRPAWRDQFKDRSDRDPPRHEKNIVNISGATLSSRHVTEGVELLLAIARAYANELGLDDVKPEGGRR